MDPNIRVVQELGRQVREALHDLDIPKPPPIDNRLKTIQDLVTTLIQKKGSEAIPLELGTLLARLHNKGIVLPIVVLQKHNLKQ